MKLWDEMTDKERNDYLGKMGGCGKCLYWQKLNNGYHPLHPLSEGCSCKHKKDVDVYDNGCEKMVVRKLAK